MANPKHAGPESKAHSNDSIKAVPPSSSIAEARVEQQVETSGVLQHFLPLIGVSMSVGPSPVVNSSGIRLCFRRFESYTHVNSHLPQADFLG